MCLTKIRSFPVQRRGPHLVLVMILLTSGVLVIAHSEPMQHEMEAGDGMAGALSICLAIVERLPGEAVGEPGRRST